MVDPRRLELLTLCMPSRYSTTELRAHSLVFRRKNGADDGTRTHDIFRTGVGNAVQWPLCDIRVSFMNSGGDRED